MLRNVRKARKLQCAHRLRTAALVELAEDLLCAPVLFQLEPQAAQLEVRFEPQPLILCLLRPTAVCKLLPNNRPRPRGITAYTRKHLPSQWQHEISQSLLLAQP